MDKCKDEKEHEFYQTLTFCKGLAQIVFRREGYMNESGEFSPSFRGWQFVLENENPRQLLIQAVFMWAAIESCQDKARAGKLYDAAMDMHKITFLMREIERKVHQGRGGRQPKSNQAIKAAVEELHKQGYTSASEMWTHLKARSIKGEHYTTEAGSVQYSPDHGGTSPGYLSKNGEPPFIKFSTFQGYVTKAKKSLSK